LVAKRPDSDYIEEECPAQVGRIAPQAFEVNAFCSETGNLRQHSSRGTPMAKILRIDLSSLTAKTEDIPDAIRKF